MPLFLVFLVVPSDLVLAGWWYANRRFEPADAANDGCPVCGAENWHVVAPDARRCTRCGHESGPGWLALRGAPRPPTVPYDDTRATTLGDVLFRLADEILEDDRVSLGWLADLALDTVAAANEWMDDHAAR